MATRVHVEVDELKPFGKTERRLRTLFVDDGESGPQAIQVRPYSGSVEIRADGRDVSINASSIPALLRALREAAKETT